MILLTSTSDKIRLTTSGAVTTDVHASSVDYNGTTVTPGRQNTAITTATTTDVVGSPGTSTQRNVKSLHIRNKHATTSQTVTVIHTDGTTACELVSVTLPAGYTLAATTTTINSATAYDIPAASNATSLTAGNVATIWGVIKPSGNGTVIARFASEIANSAITAKAGAFLRWVRVI